MTELKPVRVGFLPVLNSSSEYAIRPAWIDENTLMVGYAPDRISREQTAGTIRYLVNRPVIDVDDPYQAIAEHIGGCP